MGKLLSHLPIEMVVEIMSWVSADSLITSKCVSKSWHALITKLIDDPAFVSMHLSNSKKRPSMSFVASSNDRFFGWIPATSEDLPLAWWHDFTGKSYVRHYACHCDGIVCIQKNELVFMFNPILREYRILPMADNEYFEGFGLGYDARVNDYKFVNVIVEETQQSKVYSVNNDSWKVIEGPAELNCFMIFDPEAVYLGGVFYWCGYDADENSGILCFDVYDEEFRVMDVPEMVNFYDEEAMLTVWNDSLALCNFYDGCDSENTPCLLEIYVLDNDSGKNKGAPSWIKRVFAVPLKYIVEQVSFISNDELLILDTCNRLFMYNLLTQKFRDVSVQGTNRSNMWFCFYEKSLVSVKMRTNRNMFGIS